MKNRSFKYGLACGLAATAVAAWGLATVRPQGQMPRALPILPKRPAPAVAPSGPMTAQFAVPVLMYHRISDLTPQEARSPLMRDLTVSPHDFEQQVKYLVEHGFTFLKTRDIEAALRDHAPLPEKAVALTMDDGYKDNFEQAFPILRRYDVPATIFLVTNTVNTPGHLSWENVQTMQRVQMGYGSHTVHHYDLTELPTAQLDFELRESKRVLESRLAEPVTGLAYPSGAYNQTVAARTEAAGYWAGWKKGGGPVQPDQNMFLLPRVRVRGNTTLDEFKAAVWSGLYVVAERKDRAAKRESA
ncbi:MAG: polysaccharide deacetylase family protein [Armatimonadota bacterium]|nr:polysaccharide deacetylase family protein [Armatimonadota bacterium]